MPGVGAPAAPAVSSIEGRTRHEVARLLLEQGPITAAAVADELGISPTAVRRHLDTLLADGEAETRDAPRRGPRGRGRPAKLFLLTEPGRARFGHAYDDLAVAAIRFLAEHVGEDAVRAFAERRVAALVGPHREAIANAGDAAARAEALATALTREGYAASTRAVGAPGVAAGAQLCQHHCPVAHVAAEFPQLCEAETEAFAELLGTHVQRLATIARGDAACTTHVPVSSAGSPGAPLPGSTPPYRAAHGQPPGPAEGRTAGTANGGNTA
nr:metalloregulator ArsR/SmtB family transcription factor [Amycolatopsis arida]